MIPMNTQDVSGDGGSYVYNIPTFVGNTHIDNSVYKFGVGSYSFDGTGDYISLNHSDSYNIFGTNIDDYTLDVWIKTTDSAYQTLVNHGATHANKWYVVMYSGTTIQVVTRAADISRLNIVSSSVGNYADGNWHHIAIVIKGETTTKDVGIYFDGNRVGQDTSSSNENNTSPLILGADYNYGTNYTGYIDELRIQKSNYFSTDPSTDATLQGGGVPIEAYSLEDAGISLFNQSIIIM